MDAPEGLEVLRWLRAQGGSPLLFDSDVMKAFQWSVEQAQGVLGRLEAAGLLECRVFLLRGSQASMGDLQVTRAGQGLLERDEAPAFDWMALARRIGQGVPA
jgi:hypothetical protein